MRFRDLRKPREFGMTSELSGMHEISNRKGHVGTLGHAGFHLLFPHFEPYSMAQVKLLTLAFVREEGKILLGMKKRGFGVGRWNGFGGKVDGGETIEEAAKRELLEESGLSVQTLKAIGLLQFEFVGDPVILEVHVFETFQFDGAPTESEEMRPKWFNVSDIPFQDMWPDDHLWFPMMLKGQKFSGYFKFEGLSNIVDYTLKPCEENIVPVHIST